MVNRHDMTEVSGKQALRWEDDDLGAPVTLKELAQGVNSSHASRHENGGADEIDATGLTGIPDTSTLIANSIIDAKGDLIVGTANDTPAKLTVGTDGQYLIADAASAGGMKWGTVEVGGAFWTTMPGTPTRVGDTSFTITDTANANKYDLLLKKGTIIKWDEGGTFQWAMVITTAYDTNAVTVTIVGDSLTAGFASMKYCASKAQIETFIIAGVLAALTDTAKTWITPYPICVFSADLNVKVAGTGAGANTIDINDDGTTMFTTKPSIAENVTADIDNVSDNVETVVAAGSLITIDVDAITATTAPTDAYVKVYYAPQSWIYQS
jgi:hypothetical protein